MTRFFAAIATLSALGAAVPAQAQSRPGWDVSAEVFHYAYREPLEAEDVKDDGLMIGGAFGYTHVRGSWIGKVRGSVAAGAVDYRLGTETIDDVSQAIAQLELNVGRDFRTERGSALTPFIGLGARALSDSSGGKTTSEGSEGYDRRVTYQYVTAGAALNTPIRDGRSYTLSGQYNWLSGGSSKAYFSDLDPEAPNLEMDFTDGYGVEAYATINIQRGGGLVSAGPYLRYWNIDQSRSLVFTEGAESIEIYEPANSSWQLGLRATYNF